MPKHIKTKDLIGIVSGMLTIIEDLGTENHNRQVLAKCECGVVKKFDLARFRNTKRPTKSCGCSSGILISQSKTKHGFTGSKLYSVWNGLKGRCFNKKDRQYENYGGRGITVCEEWLTDFVAFYEWSLQNGYKETENRTCQIDRIDVNRNYEPSNCRWVAPKVNCNNRRVTIYVDFGGERLCFSDWCEKYGLDRKITHQRIFRDKMSYEEVVRKYSVKAA